jgi:hypothetical protein
MMTLYRYVDGAVVPMDAAEEAEFLATRPPAPPRACDAFTFYDRLREAGRTGAFATWLAGQDERVRIYFERSARFREDHSDVLSALAALAVDPGGVFR